MTGGAHQAIRLLVGLLNHIRQIVTAFQTDKFTLSFSDGKRSHLRVAPRYTQHNCVPQSLLATLGGAPPVDPDTLGVAPEERDDLEGLRIELFRQKPAACPAAVPKKAKREKPKVFSVPKPEPPPPAYSKREKKEKARQGVQRVLGPKRWYPDFEALLYLELLAMLEAGPRLQEAPRREAWGAPSEVVQPPAQPPDPVM
mmetsp:Transcript_111739/g.193923  ORF Transcript_111739/g.193923 Transcript_111739/m.193923 type:complete len:199 (-) Transcript_111739:255-851(-)